GRVINNVDDAATGTLNVTGAAEEGSTLTAELVDVVDADGTTTTAYQWQERVNGEWADIADATEAQLSIPGDQSYVGKEVRVVATTTDALGGTTVFEGTGRFIANVDDEATGTLSVTGAAEEGGTLTADLAGVSDADGATTTAYQWQERLNGEWTDIADATEAQLSIPDDQRYVATGRPADPTTTDALGGTTVFEGTSRVINNVDDAATGTLNVA